MKNTIKKAPLKIKTPCLHCGKEVGFDLRQIPVDGPRKFQYTCPVCGQANDITKDEKFMEFANAIGSHAGEFKRKIKESMVEMAIHTLYHEDESSLNIDAEVLKIMKNMPREELKKAMLEYWESDHLQKEQ